MVEVLISIVLLSFGVLSLLTLLPSGWRMAGTSDLLGRAAGLLQAELERNEVWIMNEKNPVTPTEGIPAPRPVYSSRGEYPPAGRHSISRHHADSGSGGRKRTLEGAGAGHLAGQHDGSFGKCDRDPAVVFCPVRKRT
jgi:hypothetical protein